VTADDRVTAIKVVAHTHDGRVFEAVQFVAEYESLPIPGTLLDAMNAANDELVSVLADRGLA
jgi:hypothetical protein